MVLGVLDFWESEKAESPWYVWVFSLFYLPLKSVIFFYFLICSTALKTVRPKATGVRIPLPAPKNKDTPCGCPLFFATVRGSRTPLCDSPSRRMGFAFERKPSVSSLTSGGAKNIRQRRIPLFQDCSTNWNLIVTLFYRV